MERFNNKSDTSPYSVAIFNCAVLAVLTFFLPVSPESKLWLKMVYAMLSLFSMPLITAYKEELKAEYHSDNNFSSTKKFVYFSALLAEWTTYFSMVCILAAPALSGEAAAQSLNPKWNDPEAWNRLGVTCVNLIMDVIPFSCSMVCLLAGMKGKKCGFTMRFSLILVCLIGVYNELLGHENIFWFSKIVRYVQPGFYLAMIPILLRLRKLESYGHLV